jgi:hypothetical protein
MNDLRNRLTEIVKRWIAAEKACRANSCGYQSCPPRDTPEWREYAILSATWQEAESDLWRATDIEYDDDPLRAACWQWRYCKVMARKCCHLQLKYPNEGSRMAAELMQNLHMAEMNLVGLLGLLNEYKAPFDKSSKCATLLA